MLGIEGFAEKAAGLAHIHLVQQGGELAYLLLHDPEYRRVRREDLIEVGRRIRLKQNLRLLSRLLESLGGFHFAFYVISAAPEEVIRSALDGVVPESHIFGTRFRYDERTGAIQSIRRVSAGYGKVAVLEELRTRLAVGYDRVVYVGDGSSDVHVMLHVNRLGGLTSRIRGLFAAHGLVLQDWDKIRTDSLTIAPAAMAPSSLPWQRPPDHDRDVVGPAVLERLPQ